ncbi:MAG: class I SAM-dependent methyltransferase [Promethearchaeota archaeon]
MSDDILEKLDHHGLREVFLKYTRKAFGELPKMKKPCILDIGCGYGGQTIELSKLTDGEFIGIDIDKQALKEFQLKIDKAGLSDRIKIRNISLYNTDFPDEQFDILWEEGVLHLLDVKKSYAECNRILKKDGYLVMFETINYMDKKLKKIVKFGFELVNHFLLPEEMWWIEYYLPLEEKIKKFKIKYKGSKDLEKLKPFESEIEMVKPNPKEFDCGFYIFQKID